MMSGFPYLLEPKKSISIANGGLLDHAGEVGTKKNEARDATETRHSISHGSREHLRADLPDNATNCSRS